MPLLHRNHSHTIPYFDIRYGQFTFPEPLSTIPEPVSLMISLSLEFLRLDDNVVLLRGSPHESAGALLKGSLAFCITDTIPVRSITLTLVGWKRLQ